MTSQEEWRQIAYQRQLGEQGHQTGNIHNNAGYQDYLRRQDQQREYDRAVWNSSQSASNTVASPSPVYRGTRNPASPGQAAFMLSLMAGGGYGLYAQSWVAGTLVFGACLVALFALRAFFATAVGQILAMLIGAVLVLAAMVGGVYFVWYAFGPTPALWVGGALAALIGLKVLGFGYEMFTSTASGARFHRRAVVAIQSLFWLALIGGGVYLYLNW